MRIAYLDCFSGISGDMTLGALVDAGVDGAAIQAAIARLGLPVGLSFETVRRGGFRATHARVETTEEHAHRHLHHIVAMIDQAGLPEAQTALAKRIFQRLGEAEAQAHGIELRKVHFHEVGAADSIVDIVGAAVGLDLLGVTQVCCSEIPTGRGFVQGAHGRMPVPAPATAALLQGVPVTDPPIEMELTTPTGAAIATTIAARFGPRPAMTVQSIGLGAGSKDLPGQANVLRLFVGEATVAGSAATDQVWVLEANLDDLAGEIVGYTTERLLAAGALDAYVTPIFMKKNRPAVVLSVICRHDQREELERILFEETTTLGVRRTLAERSILRRDTVVVETAWGAVAGKRAWLPGGAATFSPEYDSCVELARRHGVALRDVYRGAHEGALRLPPPDQTRD